MKDKGYDVEWYIAQIKQDIEGLETAYNEEPTYYNFPHYHDIVQRYKIVKDGVEKNSNGETLRTILHILSRIWDDLEGYPNNEQARKSAIELLKTSIADQLVLLNKLSC